MRSQARWQHRTVARSDVACEVGTCHRRLQCCGARSWIVYFFSWNKPIGGRGARSIAISAVLALTTMTMGALMVEWCENGSVSLVSFGNNGRAYAELDCAGPLVGAHP